MAATLYDVAAEFRQQEQLLADLDLDDQAMADTLESIAWPVEQKARAVAAVIGNMDAAAEMVKAFAKRKADEAKAMQSRADYLRKYLLNNMVACGISEIKATDGSLTLRVKTNPASTVIDDLSLIPAQYLRFGPAPPPAPDAMKIKAAIKAGIPVPGAHLEHAVKLEIK